MREGDYDGGRRGRCTKFFKTVSLTHAGYIKKTRGILSLNY